MKCGTLLLVIAGIFGASLPGAAASQPETPSLTVCVSGDISDYNLVVAGPAAIFRRIGIRTKWRGLNGCPADAIRVRVLKTGPANLPARVLGCAHPLDGRDAEVYLDRVNAAAGAAGDQRTALLGYVIAHEIVHLLEGGETQHAGEGVMRARWSSSDVEKMLWRLDLTDDDIELIRRGLRERQAQRAGAPAAATAALQ